MGIYTDILKREFPAIDDDVMEYVEGKYLTRSI